MPSEPKRKLAAIMFTDMVGYTAMMQKEESRARELIERHRALMKPFVEKHNGEVLQYVGDGTFCTFNSAIEAANSAMEIQRALAIENEINLRIGIHVGDVVSKGEEIYGDGVNIASRLEPLAEPGGVCISERVYDDIRNQSNMDAKFLGEKDLKNVDHSVKIYCLTGDGLTVSKPFKEQEKSVIESKEEEIVSKPTSKKLIPLIAGAVVILILFLARGWFGGESSVPEAAADENSLAVMFIENMTDPTDADRIGEMITMLLTTDLSQSHSLKVISSQRLYDIAKQETNGDNVNINRANATRIAKKARAQWMLTGTLSQIGSRMVLATQLENVQDGKIIEAQRVDGDDLFSLVDLLSQEVKEDLNVESAPGEIDSPVKEITTSSSEAYQLYLEGLEFLNDLSFEEAIEKFNSAVRIDSTFTKALYKLAIAQSWFESGSGNSSMETIKRILLNRESLTEGELLLVEGFKAQSQDDNSTAKDIYQRLLLMYPDDKEIHYELGETYFHSGMRENLKALDAFEEAINLDPEFTLAYKHIFDIYQQERMDDRAIRVANRLINSNPDKASGYRYLADIYGWKGELDKSIMNYQKAAERNKSNYESIAFQGWAYRTGGKYQEALSIYTELLKPNVPAIWQFRGKMISGFVYAELGQYKNAIKLMREARRIDRPISELEVVLNMASLADYYSSSGDTVRAFSILDSALAINPELDLKRYLYWQKGRLYAASGNQKVLTKLRDTFKIFTKQRGDTSRWDILYKIELFRLQGDIHNALAEYDKLDQLPHLFSLDRKATLYNDADDWEKVILTANEMQATFLFRNILFDFRCHNYPRAFYYRGIAYEEMGKQELAMENYEALLELWKGADEEIPELKDTINRLSALKQGS